MIARNEVRTSPTIFVRAAQWLQIVIFAICFYWVQNPFTPYYPQYGLDPSWIAVAGEAAARSAQWGRDIVLTYGPASSLITSYYTATLFPTINMLGGLIIAIVFGAAMNRLIASRSAGQWMFSNSSAVSGPRLVLVLDIQVWFRAARFARPDYLADGWVRSHPLRVVAAVAALQYRDHRHPLARHRAVRAGRAAAAAGVWPGSAAAAADVGKA